VHTPAPRAISAAPSTALQLETVAQQFAANLTDGDLKSLIANWTTQKGVPPEFDGRLLAKSRAEIGRDLDMDEKRFARMKFEDAVHAKVAAKP
jgi:hypothetical protein